MLRIVEAFILSALPIIELRGAIPVAIFAFGMSPLLTFVICVLGSFAPAIVIVYLLGPVSEWLRKHIKFFDKFFTWLFKYAQDKHSKKMETLKDAAVFLIAALPIPLAGAWSASLAAFVFGIPPKKSLPLIFIGTVIAGAIVLIFTVGAKALI